ncbi:MAG: phosphotransferase, partial [Dehalococcoidia bacterium]|nr:phosphotransferase [Dehalococcoidia bacterium]
MPARDLVDEDALASYLRNHLEESHALGVERIVSGKSNETFFVDWGGERWVLRRPPAGPLPPSAHDVLREYRVLTALAGRGVRAPRTILACDDASVIGVPFYLMERIPGGTLFDESPPLRWLDDARARRRVGEEMVDALAELHRVDWRAAGLESFGRPEGFVARQVERRFGQLEGIMARCRYLPEMVEVHSWLQTHLPEECSTPTIVHGDYGPHNVIFDSTAPARLAAIVDWELSTLGDPHTDVGWLTAMWADPGDPEDERDPAFSLTA